MIDHSSLLLLQGPGFQHLIPSRCSNFLLGTESYTRLLSLFNVRFLTTYLFNLFLQKASLLATELSDIRTFSMGFELCIPKFMTDFSTIFQKLSSPLSESNRWMSLGVVLFSVHFLSYDFFIFFENFFVPFWSIPSITGFIPKPLLPFWEISLSLTLTLSHSLTLPYMHTRTHAHTNTRSLSFSHFLSHTLSLIRKKMSWGIIDHDI